MFYNANRFHLLVVITWQFTIFFASQQLFGIFSNYEPRWKCGDDGEFGKNCSEYTRCEGNITFEKAEFDSAVVEFKWVCNDSHYTMIFSQVQFAGVLCGTLSFGAASDVYGRKPIAILAMTIGLTANFVSGLVTNIYQFFVIRYFVGLAIGGCLVVLCTFVMEMLLPQQRMALRAFFNWGTARLMVTLLCMWTREWRLASFACAVTALPALAIIIFVFPESPTWLHSKGRLDDMRESEKAIARRAGVPYVPVQHKKIEKGKSLVEVLKGGLLKRLITLWVMWFVASTCGYATDLNSNTISGDFYVNQCLYSILIAASKIVLVAVDTYVPGFSRRVLHQASQLGAVICFGALTVLTVIEYDGTFTLVTNLIGTVFVEFTWDACYLCAVESMETSSRASAMGSCSLMARVGALMAPALKQLNQQWSASLYLIVAILGTVNLLQSYFTLVETKNVVLDNVTVTDDHNPLATSEEEAVELENGHK